VSKQPVEPAKAPKAAYDDYKKQQQEKADIKKQEVKKQLQPTDSQNSLPSRPQSKAATQKEDSSQPAQLESQASQSNMT
jgi:hypothetical protein